MKRLNGIGSWKRIGLQGGLLAGLGLAFVGGAEQPVQAEMDTCPQEGECTFKKPNFMVIMDYSTSMNNNFGGGQTRWEAAVDAVNKLATTKFNNENLHLGLMRYGHDPSGTPGTTIPGDNSNPPITDGQALDVAWYDAEGDDKTFYPCNGDALVNALTNDIPPPMDGELQGIGTWTKGALDLSADLVFASKADHPEDGGERFYASLVMTDGSWTQQNGIGQSPGDNPASTAADLWDNQQIPTYVVYFGDPNDNAASASAAELATAGGTTSINAENAAELDQALIAVVQNIKDNVVQPICSPGLPRFMVLLDASSSMLNVDGGTMAGAMGETGWDKAREALAGPDSIFRVKVQGNQEAEDLIHLGLAVFGHNTPNPGEQKILVDYGPCLRDNFEWALDPNTSCGDGCNDPWGGPPISWTFVNSDEVNPPPFVQTTISHMPKCLGAAFCSGSGTYTHLGLQLIKNNQADYHAFASDPNNNPPFPSNDNTVYANILVTDGQYDTYSTDAQVQGELTQMYNNGITTYVVGFGDGVNTPAAIAQLEKMADWGSGGMIAYFQAADQMELENAFKNILEGISFDPCCSFNDCSVNPEPGQQNECNPEEPETCQEDQTCELDNNDEWYICKNALCGNGELDPGEQCDDGNTIDGDGCSSKCLLEDCGNGVGEPGEECDDGNQINNDECTNACTLPKCGDGIVHEQLGEECDDGVNNGPDGTCSEECKVQDPPDTTTDTATTTDGETETSDSGGSATDTGGTTTGPTTDGSAGSSVGDETESDGTATTGETGGIDDEGCGCSVDESTEGKARGLLGVLFGLGFAGMIRRRRRD